MERNIRAEPIASGVVAPELMIRAASWGFLSGFRKRRCQAAMIIMITIQVIGLESPIRIVKAMGKLLGSHGYWRVRSLREARLWQFIAANRRGQRIEMASVWN